MQRFLSSKILMIGLLILCFLIAFMFIRGTIYERQANYQQVVRDIARNNVSSQTVMTPFIVVPMSTSYVCEDDQKKTCYRRDQIVITPQKTSWTNKVNVDDQRFKRGIYRAISYQNKISIIGSFSLSDTLLNPAQNQWIDWQNAKMRFYLSDLRGLKSQPVLTIAQKKISFELPKEKGINPLNVDYTQTALPDLAHMPSFEFRLDVDIMGTSSFQALPLGEDLAVSMIADWPHPSFFGESLPLKQLNNQDFKADWQNVFLSSRNTQLLSACLDASTESCSQLQQAFGQQNTVVNYGQNTNTSAVGGFGVNFIQSVDMYLMTERAVKYAALFLVITFGTFFLFEILKGLAIHPIQYTLVGTALAVFYLLLLSFSEHIGFMTAYIMAATACVGLITFYVSYVLHSVKRSVLFGVILTAMYGAMFMILKSEDFTLILGSVLVFILIAVMMFLTRHVDWYNLKQEKVQ
jgi:inner membrane protein